MKILVLDNYDSFTYNLVTLLRDHTDDVAIDVRRNDCITLDEVEAYDKILISPGPSVPDEAGITKALIKRYASYKSILGVCLGHQAIAEVFGAKIFNMSEVFHGHSSQILIKEASDYLLKNILPESAIGLYHSWSVDPASVSEELEVTATNREGHIMAIRHRAYDVHGLQFHPESILTKNGAQYIKNWLNTNETINQCVDVLIAQ